MIPLTGIIPQAASHHSKTTTPQQAEATPKINAFFALFVFSLFSYFYFLLGRKLRHSVYRFGGRPPTFAPLEVLERDDSFVLKE